MTCWLAKIFKRLHSKETDAIVDANRKALSNAERRIDMMLDKARVDGEEQWFLTLKKGGGPQNGQASSYSCTPH